MAGGLHYVRNDDLNSIIAWPQQAGEEEERRGVALSVKQSKGNPFAPPKFRHCEEARRSKLTLIEGLFFRQKVDIIIGLYPNMKLITFE